jgi:hypothetical protein
VHSTDDFASSNGEWSHSGKPEEEHNQLIHQKVAPSILGGGLIGPASYKSTSVALGSAATMRQEQLVPVTVHQCPAVNHAEHS